MRKSPPTQHDEDWENYKEILEEDDPEESPSGNARDGNTSLVDEYKDSDRESITSIAPLDTNCPHPRIQQDRGGGLKPCVACDKLDNGPPVDNVPGESSSESSVVRRQVNKEGDNALPDLEEHESISRKKPKRFTFKRTWRKK